MVYLCPRFQVLKPEVLAKFPDQVNEEKLRDEICHELDPQSPDGVKVNF